MFPAWVSSQIRCLNHAKEKAFDFSYNCKQIEKPLAFIKKVNVLYGKYSRRSGWLISRFDANQAK